MINKLKNIFNGRTAKWNQTNNNVVKEMLENLRNFDGIIEVIFNHLLISTDLFASELFGINGAHAVFDFSKTDITKFKKLYTIVICFYGYNIALKNESIYEELMGSLPQFCPDIESIKETIRIFNKFSKTEQLELSKVGFKVLDSIGKVFGENISVENNISSLQKLILYYNTALNSIHMSLNIN
ncbi:MAG: hypothetical protein WAU11_10545 [Ignavibacteriaceae bacterium]